MNVSELEPTYPRGTDLLCRLCLSDHQPYSVGKPGKWARKASCELFSQGKNVTQDCGQPSLRNFLVVCPEQMGGAAASDEWIDALATCLNRHGFAYVARAGQVEPQDTPSGVRYLPLRQSLPDFGLMTAVIVIQDSSWAKRAADIYPQADIYLLNARASSSRLDAGGYANRLPISMIIGRTCTSTCMRWAW